MPTTTFVPDTGTRRQIASSVREDSRATDIVCVRPPGLLAGGLRHVSGYRERHPVAVRVREIASSSVRVIIGIGGDPLAVHSGAGVGPAQTHMSRIAGPNDATTVTTLGGTQQGIHLRLSPLQAYTVFGVPMHELSRRFTDLDAVLGPAAVRLADELADAPDWPQRFAVLDATLRRLRAAGPAPDPAVAWAWRELVTSGGTARIATLAERLGVSRRHLVRRFHEQIGLGPKAAARVVRVERAVRLLRRGTGTHADVAAASGYSDHAHLGREIRTFTGAAPSQVAGSLRTAGPADVAMSHFFKL